MGEQYGAAVRADKVRYVYENYEALRAAGKGTPKRPHRRKQHWARYWYGPRKNRTDGQKGDYYDDVWIPPIYVNSKQKDVEELPVTIKRVVASKEQKQKYRKNDNSEKTE